MHELVIIGLFKNPYSSQQDFKGSERQQQLPSLCDCRKHTLKISQYYFPGSGRPIISRFLLFAGGGGVGIYPRKKCEIGVQEDLYLYAYLL